MRSIIGCCVLILMAVMPGEPQNGGTGIPHVPPNLSNQPHQPPYPEPTTSSEESMRSYLQWMHEQNLEDTSRLVKLSQELKWDLADHDRDVLSLATIRKMDEIERLIKKIRGRVGKK